MSGTIPRAVAGGLVLLAVGLPAPAGADVEPLEEEVLLSTSLSCIPTFPRLELLPDGGTVTVWRGGDAASILGRLRDAAGEPAGDEKTLVSGSPVAALDLTADGAGRWTVAWHDPEGTRVAAQRFDAGGEPLGEEIVVALGPGIGGSAIDAAPDGRFVVLWSRDTTLRAQRFDADGESVGGPVEVATMAVPLCPACFLEVGAPDVAMGPNGGFVAVWEIVSGTFPGVPPPAAHTVAARRFDAEGRPLGDLLTLGAGRHPAVATDGAGRAVVAWQRTLDDFFIPGMVALRLDAAGAPTGDPIDVGPDPETLSRPDVATDSEGSFLVVWETFQRFTPGSDLEEVVGRLFSPEGLPASPLFRLNSDPSEGQVNPAAALGDDGSLVAAWERRPPFPPILPPDCSQPHEVFARRFEALCIPGAGRLCLNGGRFAVEVDWESPRHGTSGRGRAVPVAGDTGAFWFFERKNLELMVKALDGRTVNGHFWVFFGGLSDVAYTVRVTDRATGRRRIYPNPAGTLASRADTTAFADAGLPAGDDPGGVIHGLPPGLLDPPCGPPHQLCLQQRRFGVEVAWRSPVHGTAGQAEPLYFTDHSGTFWFFDEENQELLVKVLDGRRINGRFWVFYGALSNVEYDITVTDFETGASRTYHNPAGRLASRADTAFPTGPCVCPEIFQPVCGDDGKTYDNACFATCAAVPVAHPGSC